MVAMLVFVLVSCSCLHRLCCRVANAADAAIDTKCTAAIAIAIAPAVALTAAIANRVASAIAPPCNHRCLAVAVAVAVGRVVVRLVAVAAAAAAAAAMSGRQRWRTCAALVEERRSDNNTLLGLHCLARLALLGSLCLACVKARPLTR